MTTQTNHTAENCSWLEPRAGNDLTETVNAERFVQDHKDKIRFVRKINKWLGYDGRRWSFDIGKDMAKCLYLQTARRLYNGISSAVGFENKQALLRAANQAESAKGMWAALSIAEAFPEITVPMNDFDADPYLFNCLNGTIDLRTGVLQAHNPDDMITKLAPVNYDPNATLELWEEVLQTATGEDKTLLNFLQVAAGYSITGDTSEERVFFIYGDAGSCKTTFLEPIKKVLGDYAKTSDFSTFVKQKNSGGARNDIARLHGARFVTTSEIDEKKHLDENLFKQISGRNTISARFLYKEAFEFQPQFKLWMEANEAPRIRDAGDGSMWRRLLRVPFDYSIPIEKQDKSVKADLLRLEESGAAILAWLVQGCLRWQKEGLVVPDAVVLSTKTYKESQEDLREFFDDRCDFAADTYVEVSKMRSAYEEWAKNNGIKYTLGSKRFNNKLRAKGCKYELYRIPISTGTLPPSKCWLGVQLRKKECL